MYYRLGQPSASQYDFGVDAIAPNSDGNVHARDVNMVFGRIAQTLNTTLPGLPVQEAPPFGSARQEAILAPASAIGRMIGVSPGVYIQASGHGLPMGQFKQFVHQVESALQIKFGEAEQAKQKQAVQEARDIALRAAAEAERRTAEAELEKQRAKGFQEIEAQRQASAETLRIKQQELEALQRNLLLAATDAEKKNLESQRAQMLKEIQEAASAAKVPVPVMAGGAPPEPVTPPWLWGVGIVGALGVGYLMLSRRR